MNSKRRYCLGLVLAALCVATAGVAYARKNKEPPKLLAKSQVVQDLYYGDVLFYFYQGDNFQALTRVDAALTQGRVEHHQIEAQLLKGALYLSLGQHIEAGRIFQELLNENVPDATRNRAWFYLAKVWYQRGYLNEAEQALSSITGKLEDELESERKLLQAEVLMGQGRYDEAIGVLSAWPAKDRYTPYARFNLGVALVRVQRTDDAIRMLDEVGQMAASTEELRALRDKANLALGFALLKDNHPLEAADKLQRIRLRGPLSNKALLGAGWADAAGQHYQAALVPWQELRGRSLLDAAVQESYLAVPYAYAQLSATRQAAEQYASAIEAFHAESARIEESIAAIRAGRLLDTILEKDTEDKVGWYWQLQQLPDAPETRYLFHLLASHEFQEGLKNYRDLKLMQRNLNNWALAAVAFQDMIDTRRLAYAQRLPVIDGILGKVDLPQFEARKIEIGARLAMIERDEDVTGLATPHEAEQWSKVQALNDALGNADVGADKAANDEMREKLRMIRGVLYWNMSAGYKARLWHVRKENRELEVAVQEARRRWTLVERARADSPEHTEEFASRVAEVQPRIATLLTRLEAEGQTQNQYLASIAIKELTAQQERLASYGLQAQFALASIYDKAANGAGAQPKPASTAREDATPSNPTTEPASDAIPPPTSITPPPTSESAAPPTEGATAP